MEKDGMKIPHKITLNERSQLTVTGVTEVISFDESAVALNTPLGSLTVHGQQLQLKTLSVEGGQVVVEGNICAMIYQEPRQSAGWLGRLFR